MITVIWYTIRETIHRRMGVVVLILSLLSPVFFLWRANFRTAPDGQVFGSLGRLELPAAPFVRGVLEALLELGGTTWMWVGIFMAAPLLTSYLEKGWAEMQFAKGLPRWQFFISRYAGTVILFGASLFCVAGLPALYFHFRTGVPVKNFLLGLFFLILVFAALAALMSLVGVQQALPAVPTLTGFLTMLVAAVLAQRENTIYRIIESQWPKTILDWVYRMLPKTSELSRAASGYWRTGAVESWWPVWSTALFLAGCLGLAIWRLNRKSF